MKGYELLKNIAEGIIKQGAEIKEYKNDKLNETYMLKTTIQEKDTGYEMYNNHLYEKEYTYFVNNPEENKEIEELNEDWEYTQRGADKYLIRENREKINEIIRKINKEREEKYR